MLSQVLHHLFFFKVDEECKNLNEKRAVDFHHLVAKIIFATKRVRPDTCTAILFLTKIMREPDNDDCAKLFHIMIYIRGKRNLPLITISNIIGILKWCMDGSFVVYPNMREHTGGGLSTGIGFTIFSSTKQKLNTPSSTETEIAAVGDCMPAVLRPKYLFYAQGCDILITLYIKTIKVLLCWKTTARLQAVSAQST